MTRPLRLPVPTPAEVAAAAGIVRRHLDEVLREDRNVGCRKPLVKPEYHRVMHALRVVQTLERSSSVREA